MSTFQINNRITVLLAKLPGLPLPSLPFTVLVNDTRWPNKQIDFTEHNVMVIVINSPVSGSWYCFQHVCVSVCVCVCLCVCLCVRVNKPKSTCTCSSRLYLSLKT